MDSDVPDNERLRLILDKLPVEDSQEQLDLMRQAIDIALVMKDTGIIGDVEQKLKKKTKFAIAKIRKLIAEERRLLQIPVKPEVDLPRKALITIKCSDTREYELGDNGILQIDTHTSDKGEYVTQEYLWKWDSFKVLMHFVQTSIYGEVDRFNFEIDGKVFQGRTIAEFQKEIFAEHHLGGAPSILGTCLSEFIKKNHIPQTQFSEICGFAPDGWRLPPEYYFEFRIGIHAEYYENIAKMMQIKPDPKIAKQMMRNLYNSISVKGKDRIFVWALYAPFSFALREYLQYMFFLGLLSTIPQTGKTTIAESVVCKWWGHAPPYNKDNFNSASRVGKYLSGTTFPIIIDDCGELTDEAKGPLKAHATSATRDQKQRTDHTFAVDRPYQCNLLFTSQDVPDLYNDTGVAERLFIENMDDPMSADQAANFLIIFGKMPAGYLGKYIIDATRDLTAEEMAETILSMYDAPETILVDGQIIPTDSRKNLIYKIFQYFAMLFEKLFDIKLDVSQVPELVEMTRARPNDDIFAITTKFIQISNSRQWDDDDNRPKDNLWVQSRVKLARRGNPGVDCYALDTTNALDIARKLNVKKLNLTQLAAKLKTRWPSVDIGTSRSGERTQRTLFIPKRCIDE